MALKDAIDYLTEVNEKTLEESELTNLHIEELTDRVGDLIDLNKEDRLDRLESMRERASFDAPSMTGGGGPAATAVKKQSKGLPALLGDAFVGFFGLTGFLASLKLFSANLLRLFKNVGRFLGPIGLIITGIIATFETVRGFLKGYEEDGILGGLEGAVKALVDELVAKPLDLLKDVVSWLADRLGLGIVSKMLNDFSFSDLYDDLLTSIFDGLQNVVNLVTDIFYFPEDGESIGLQNFGNLIDTVMLPLNAAINFVGDVFGWSDPEEPFRLSVFVSDAIKNGMNLVLEVFGFEPMDTEKTLMSFLSETFDTVFASITQVVKDFGDRLLVEGEIAFRQILVFIQNIPDQLMKFVSDNLSFKLPMIAIPNPIPKPLRNVPGAPKEDSIVIFGGTDEIRVPGGDTAAANIAQRNANLDADIQRIRNQSGSVVQQMNAAVGASGGGTTVIYQTTNNVSGGAGGGSAGAVGVGGSTATAPNDYHGTLDATQVISGGPSR